jgi:hypothetical protein
VTEVGQKSDYKVCVAYRPLGLQRVEVVEAVDAEFRGVELQLVQNETRVELRHQLCVTGHAAIGKVRLGNVVVQ